MRIALVSHSNAPWTRHYAQSFMAGGHDVCVISFHSAAVAGVSTVLLGRAGRDSVPKHRYVTGAPALRSALHAYSPDVVLATYLTSNGLAAALAWNGPLVVSGMGADVLDQPGGVRLPFRVRALLLRFVCRRAAMVHVVSDEIADGLRAMDVPSSKIVVFSVGVDVARFRPIDAIRRASAGLRIICTRTHDAVYRNDVVVDAFARLLAARRDVHLDLVGDGPLLEACRRQVERLGLQPVVTFVPRVANEDMPALLRRADIYVSASSSDGTSASLLEGLATGLLPVVTRIRANEPWIRDGENGFLFNVGDVDDLARVLALACDRDDVRERAREENPSYVRDHANRAANDARLLALLAAAARTRR